jgi:hypothetical protein
MRCPSMGKAAEPQRSVHCPAKRAAVDASPFTPGRSTPALTTASTIAATASGLVGVRVAKKSSGDWKRTPVTASPSLASQYRPGSGWAARMQEREDEVVEHRFGAQVRSGFGEHPFGIFAEDDFDGHAQIVARRRYGFSIQPSLPSTLRHKPRSRRCEPLCRPSPVSVGDADRVGALALFSHLLGTAKIRRPCVRWLSEETHT